ncbi:MAG: hypothetical protein M0R21_00990 [Lentimicrobiaceae bacterium]|nr:hypothetical protein [Lentimicrobiaceae bacterium]
MKKFLFILLVIPIAFGCNQKKIKDLELKNDSLTSQAQLKDTTIMSYLKSFNDIQSNLDSIKGREMVINESTSGNVEMKPNTQEKILNDIQIINDLMQQNKQKLGALQAKLKKSNVKVVELERMVENLTKQIADKDAEIITLKEQLAKLNLDNEKLNASVRELNARTDAQTKTINEQTSKINEQTTALNTAFWCIGTRKELKKNNVIARGGKLLPNFNKNFFTKIDVTQVTSINIGGKKIKMLTTHPSSSYKMIGDKKIESITITNPHEFWSTSKFLVIEE